MKIWKWVLGFFTLIGGAIAIFAGSSKKGKKIKEVKKQIKNVDKTISTKKTENKKIQKNIQKEKKNLNSLKKQKSNVKSKEVGVDEAADFLKKYAKKKGKK